jgi:transcriptional regulator CtsR
LLRHYPYVWNEQRTGEDTGIPTEAWRQMKATASERMRQVLSQKNDCPVQDNAAKQDILTDEERAAVASCIADDEAATAYERADTLRGLLERLK